ncbi:MAG TPA: hypothetical protein VMD08_18230 [Candidatus Baltobacteraceae bacterium]|nr:hypothetical protein [Candidatus Baltobacteraceae bacterium]
MRLRRFEGTTVAEALAKVRAELGADAVILHTRAGEGGEPGRCVEVTAAADGPAPALRLAPSVSPRPLSRPEPAAEDRLEDIYRMVRELHAEPDTTRSAHPLARALQREEVPRAVADRLLRALPQGGRTAQTAGALHRVLVRAFRVCGPLAPGRRQRIVVLVGPTGVGKTTTLAKLAGQLRQSGITPSLISLDTYRIGAVAQMQIYAELLGVGFHVARSAAELRGAVAAETGADLILIDSTGRSPSHREGIAALHQALCAVPEVEVHLAVSATTKGTDVDEILRRFKPLGYRYLVVTKLDEARTLGPLLGVALDRGLPISYLTTGQEVPHDLEPATPRALADLLMPERPRRLARA